MASESVPWGHYEAVIRELEDERIAHADTKSQLMDTQDKLAFAHGEIDILRKQIEREKMQFEKTFGVLKSKALKETMKSIELQNKCEQIEEQREQQTDTLSSREHEVEALTQRLQQTQEEYKHQLEEVNVQMQQELYITNLMMEREQRGHAKKHDRGRINHGNAATKSHCGNSRRGFHAKATKPQRTHDVPGYSSGTIYHGNSGQQYKQIEQEMVTQ